MSQEEHILHQLKGLHDWTVNINKQVVRIMWTQFILTAFTLIAILVVIFK